MSDSITTYRAIPAFPTLVFMVQPTDTISGVSISPAVVVAVQDAAGNTITDASNAITITMMPVVNGNPLSVTATAVHGLATFSGIVPIRVPCVA